ncbi:MAG: flagellar basal body P-ring formation protein FlgA [Alphaproteobacteria bacterium]|nr:flagellar basal body P-ring formation protein FlgA [Alphaproteobacteria bacterium]
MNVFRIAFLVLAFLTSAAPAFADEPKLALLAAPPVLKGQALVEGDILVLGDIFDNLDAVKAKKPVAYAPKPGSRTTLEANWLYALAQQQGVAWRPASLYDRIVVERAGQTVAREAIENALLSALAPYGVASDSAVELANRSISLNIPVDAKPVVAVRALTYDERSRRFSATLEVPAGTPNALQAKVSGRVVSQLEIPVLARSIQKNEPIAIDDLKMVPVSADMVRADTITDPGQIAGKAPRRFMKAGQTVSLQDIQRPVMVPKNSTVTMVLRSAGMTLTAMGQANEDGGQGDIIHVTNSKSRSVVEATVIGQGLVTVRPQSARAIN